MEKQQKQIAHKLYCAGILDYKSLTGLQDDNTSWLKARCMGLGAALVLAGVVCFFAFNWAQMGKVLKLGLPLMGFIATGLWAAVAGFERPSSKILAFVSAFFIGVFCAVFGQVYQTGADAWQLFFTWALCILPFAFIVQSAAMWLLFVIVGNLFLSLYTTASIDPHLQFVLVSLFNILFVVLAFAAQKLALAINRTWFLYTVFVFAVTASFLGALADLFEKDLSTAFLLFWVFSIGSFVYIFKLKKHITLIGTLALFLVAMALCVIGKTTRIYEPLFWAFLSLASYTAAGFGVLAVNKYFKTEGK